MDNTAALKQDIKRLMVENLMLQIRPDEISDDQPLFGPGGLGLDSVDALQLVVAIAIARCTNANRVPFPCAVSGIEYDSPRDTTSSSVPRFPAASAA